jgi:hypothetical protein
MKQDDTLLVGAIKELERAYDRLMPLFNLDMPKPIITIQSKGGQSLKAWFSACRWSIEQGKAKKELHEINICAEYLAHGIDDIANSLTHEMVHYGNHVKGLKDCSSNQYHNGNFKARKLQGSGGKSRPCLHKDKQGVFSDWPRPDAERTRRKQGAD